MEKKLGKTDKKRLKEELIKDFDKYEQEDNAKEMAEEHWPSPEDVRANNPKSPRS